MESFYQILGVGEQSGADEIERAYQRQRERYDPSRVADMDADLRRRAEERTAELERAYATLVDPERRQAYDGTLAGGRRAASTGVTRREIMTAVAGVAVGLAVIAAVWVLAGRSAEPALPPVGEMSRPAPEIDLPALGGGKIRLSDYRGKVVIINFWGTWCEPCKEETPALQQVYAKLRGQGLEVIGVNLYDQETGGEAGVRKFLEPYGVSYPIALDDRGQAARTYQISPIPVSYFVDQSGTIRYVKVGALKAADVEALFARLRQSASAQP